MGNRSIHRRIDGLMGVMFSAVVINDGLIDRLQRQAFGRKLIVHFIDRFDQICFKTYAAINSGSARHLSDLRSLKPTDFEMLTAIRWTLSQDVSDQFPALVRSFLRAVGYSHVADQL